MSQSIALVLAGGGARGAYEAGVLSVILPALPEAERPNIIVGASVGAVNGAYLAASDGDLDLKAGRALWEEITWGDVLATPSLRDLDRIARAALTFTGLLSLDVPSLLDATPLKHTLERLIPFEAIGRQVDEGRLISAAVVATSALTGRSVVFHQGGTPEAVRDHKRGIDYVPTILNEQHVRASSAIPAAFPAVEVTDGPAAGWYFDGGTRLNAPIKPALSLGAERVIVVGLNSIAPGGDRIAGPDRPDVFAGASHIIDALLTDPLVEDIQTLTTINELVGERRTTDYRKVPYIFIAPPERDTIGRIARQVFRRFYGGVFHAHRSPQLAFLGRLMAAGADPLHGELLSYLFFAPEFAHALIERGRADAQGWLDESHDEGLWDTGPLGRRKR
ncbi:patatin-like phospholipase family protein [Solirubrobacter ginsenosidimutans]|uniref:Patatin-like phospholipase family protein n=1 Tax=Solirubrobacter ginsenosidimutans TaxID=490573 RepID=A0A9X3N3G2_9ACTN|nr:patatin-like phospholipase family protein [Solirubrobacter ginsenosidimutans]MDA0166556.1 patatin-like phospholipase family protein [Solirubrobacter ginsenosidimutans]